MCLCEGVSWAAKPRGQPGSGAFCCKTSSGVGGVQSPNNSYLVCYHFFFCQMLKFVVFEIARLCFRICCREPFEFECGLRRD